MTEYYFETGEWLDLRHAVAIKDHDWIESILHAVEMRHYKMKAAQEAMRIKAWLHQE